MTASVEKSGVIYVSVARKLVQRWREEADTTILQGEQIPNVKDIAQAAARSLRHCADVLEGLCDVAQMEKKGGEEE